MNRASTEAISRAMNEFLASPLGLALRHKSNASPAEVFANAFAAGWVLSESHHGVTLPRSAPKPTEPGFVGSVGTSPDPAPEPFVFSTVIQAPTFAPAPSYEPQIKSGEGGDFAGAGASGSWEASDSSSSSSSDSGSSSSSGSD